MKTFHYHKILLLILCLVSASLARAGIVQGLYESEKIVPNQTAGERDKAMKNALMDVLAKISGRPDVGTVPDIITALENPRNYVQQYRYRKIPEHGYIMKDAAAGSQILWLAFDEQAVNKLLQKNNLPVWGRTRPSTLVWLAVEQEGSRFIVNNNTPDEIRFVLEIQAKRRGISLVLPLMDLEDQQKLNFTDVWTNNQVPIFAASKRYQADAVLVGHINVSANDNWQGHWVLYEGGQGLSWNNQAEAVSEMLDGGVLGSMEILASRYAQVYDNSSPGSFDIAVTDITTLDQYARVSNYLHSLEQVKGVYPTYIDNNSVTYRLDIRGNSKGLIQTIRLGNVLAAVSSPESAGADPMKAMETGQQIEIQESSSTTAHVYRLVP